jgi:hypothetical protein
MEKRRHPRIGNIPYLVDISDGVGFYTGYVNNLSRFGICLQDIPNRLNQHAEKLSVVISGGGQNFKIKARARWTEQQKYSKNIGLEIVNAPWGWTEFVMEKEPPQDDIWG